jgi:DNA-binding NtrC family response regulator
MFSHNESFDIGALGKVHKPIEEVKRDAEKKLIIKILDMYQGNKSKTAEYLKIPRPLLYQKMKRLGI